MKAALGDSRQGNWTWPHAPAHRLSEGGVFMVTSGTYRKIHHFHGSDRLKALHTGLLRYAKSYGWELSAWAVFPNHYHFVGHSPPNENGAKSLSTFLAHFHQKSASWVNAKDGALNRRVWHNFWETRLTYEMSYLARLNYVHQNAVRHKVVPVANQYPWCSAGVFEQTAKPSTVRTVYSFKVDQLKIDDDF